MYLDLCLPVLLAVAMFFSAHGYYRSVIKAALRFRKEEEERRENVGLGHIPNIPGSPCTSDYVTVSLLVGAGVIFLLFALLFWLYGER